MDPFTLALATFGVQKLRGKSTGRSFRDALLMGGIGQLGSMTSMGQGMGLQGFGQGAGQLKGATLGAQLRNTGAANLALGQQTATSSYDRKAGPYIVKSKYSCSRHRSRYSRWSNLKPEV